MSTLTLQYQTAATRSQLTNQTRQDDHIVDFDISSAEAIGQQNTTENNVSSVGERNTDAETDGYSVAIEEETGGLVENGAAGVDHVIPMRYPPRNNAFVGERARRDTFRLWPRTAFHEIERLVYAGFFFTGQEDILRCFHCDIGLSEWAADDDPWMEHARHSQDCPYLRDCKGHEFVQNVQKDWSKIYNPKHPNMNTAQQRQESFNNDNWPRDFVTQTPEQLAEAGFFYTGDTDTVRCHYCDGGLREWDDEDDPWVEHARWFPFCKYVLKIKGLVFIQNSAVENVIPDEAANIGRRQGIDGQRNILPPDTYVNKCRRKEWINPIFTAAAESVMDMGYSKYVTMEAINMYIEETGKRDFTSAELLNIIFDIEENNNLPDTDKNVSSDELDENKEFELTAKALRKENEYIKQKISCLNCKNRERCMVFTPCGHRLYCNKCSKTHQNCSECGLEIESSVKTFLG